MTSFRGANPTQSTGKTKRGRGRPPRVRPPTPQTIEEVGTRVPISVPPPEVSLLEPNADKVQRGGYTEAEDDEHMRAILWSRLQGGSIREIVAAARKQYGIGETRVRNLLKRGLETLKSEVDELKPYSRAEQITRIRAYLQDMIKLKRFTNILEAEQLLAKLEGNEEPERIDLSVTVGNAATKVLLEMPQEERNALLQQALERKRLADIALALPALAEGVSVAVNGS